MQRAQTKIGLEAVDVLKPHLIALKAVFDRCFVLPLEDKLVAVFAHVLNVRTKSQDLAFVAVQAHAAPVQGVVGGLLKEIAAQAIGPAIVAVAQQVVGVEFVTRLIVGIGISLRLC